MIVYSGWAAVAAAAAVRRRRINAEREGFQYAELTIPELVAKGADEHIWIVDAKADSFPESRLGWFGRVVDPIGTVIHPAKPGHKLPSESAADYLKSVFLVKPDRFFRRIEFYENDRRIEVAVGGIYLSFAADKESAATERRPWVFFEPGYYDSGAYRIERETDVRTHKAHLRYKGFSRDRGVLEGLNRVRLPPRYGIITSRHIRQVGK